MFGVVCGISHLAGRVELCGHKLSLCSINNSADKQKSAPPVGKYFSWTKQLWISPGFYKKCDGQFMSPSRLSCGMNTMLCVLALLEIIHVLPSVRPSPLTPTGTNSFEQSSTEADGYSPAEEIPRIIWIPRRIANIL